MDLKIRSVKCPNCGAALSAPNMDGGVICLFCGSLLQIVGAKLSQPKTQPAPIKPETGASSTRQAIEELRKRLLANKKERRQQTSLSYEEAAFPSNHRLKAVILGIVIIVRGFVVGRVDTLLVLLILVEIAYIISFLAGLVHYHHEKKRVAGRIAAATKRLRQLHIEEKTLAGHIASLERDLERMTQAG